MIATTVIGVPVRDATSSFARHDGSVHSAVHSGAVTPSGLAGLPSYKAKTSIAKGCPVLNFLSRHKTTLPSPDQALSGREHPIPTSDTHFVLGTPLKPPFPSNSEQAVFGLGCFWGAERIFWELGEGIHTTAVGYAGGATPNPTYEEACSGRTGHTEAVLVVFDPAVVTYEALLKHFWESHDPTQGMRQGNDRGTQYRSAVYTTTPEQAAAVEASRTQYNDALARAHKGEITTEITEAGPFYYAEEYHQQYLAKNPNGYCGIGGTGVACPIGLGTPAA